MPKKIDSVISKIRMRVSDSKDQTVGRTTDLFKLALAPHNVVILHPSFCCPAMAESGKKIVLFVLADDAFKALFEDDRDAKKPWLKTAINAVLKILPWADDKKIKDVPLYPDSASAIANIEIHSLGNITDDSKGRVRNKDGKLFAILRPSAQKFYVNNHGVSHLFQIELAVGGMSVPPTIAGGKTSALYEAAWLLPDPDRPHDINAYAEPQDRKTQDFIRSKGVGVCDAGPPCGYVVPAGNDNVSQFGFELDKANPVRNRHPILITGTAKLNLGHLTDVHVSSRQFAFRQSSACVLQSLDPEQGSAPIGSLVNVSYEGLENLLTQLGGSAIDALVVTGDLVDHNHNFDPVNAEGENWQEALSVPGKLWEHMHHDHHAGENYPKFIDDTIIYSLFKRFYDVHQKPIFLVQGNHELYTTPFAISPRIFGIDALRANEGIPADHNLTIYEALLMYGPDYDWTRIRSDKRMGPQNVDWYYTVFTPFTDYHVEHVSQSFIGLGWGDDEDILSNFGGGTLPRTPTTVSTEQWELVEAATQSGKEAVLFTHFTFASYATHIPLGASGKIDCSPGASGYSHFEEGSFKQRRHAMYKLLADKKIKYTLSGHSHRFGLYEPLKLEEWEDMSGNVNASLHVKGHLPGSNGLTPAFDGCRIITGACGGPIAVQNHYEKKHVGLNSCGLDAPSGVRLTVNGAEKIEIVRATNATAQPRFAVALDYLDIIGIKPPPDGSGRHDKKGVFTRFESSSDEGAFVVTVNRYLPDVNEKPFIKGMDLVAYITDDLGYGQWRAFPLNPKVDGPSRMTTCIDIATQLDIDEKVIAADPPPPTFISVAFNNVFQGILGYTQYDYSSPWIFRVQIEKVMRDSGYGKSATKKAAGGYRVSRHGKYGEIPDFRWYKKNFKKVFPYERKLPKSETKDDKP